MTKSYSAQAACTLTWLALLVLPVWGGPVAVVDFETPDAKPAAEQAAFGLADVLAAELQQRGAELFERQQIRMILAERRLTLSGLAQLQKIPNHQIPDLDYIITGTFRLTNQQFRIESALVEARTGRNVASFAQEGGSELLTRWN